MLYKFIDRNGTFTVKEPSAVSQSAYLPLTDAAGALLSSISPNLAGDIKADNDSFVTPPASIEDLRANSLCRRDFFLKIKNKIIRLSEPSAGRIEGGILYQKLYKQYGPLKITITSFIPHDIPAEVMQVNIKNISKKPVSFTPFSFVPLYARSAENIRDHRHVLSLLNRVELIPYGIILKPTMLFDERGHKLNQRLYFCLGFQNKALLPAGQFPTLDLFLGRGGFSAPGSIEKNLKPLKSKTPGLDGKEACGAFRFKTNTLAPGKEACYGLITGSLGPYGGGKKKIFKIFDSLNSPKKLETSLKQTKDYWKEYLDVVRYDFNDDKYNNWLTWVKLQPRLRKLFGCSFLPHFDYGKGGRGWRDLWQDTLTLLLYEPEAAKQMIINSFKGVRLDGTNATIIAKDGTFLSDRNKINRVWCDHGIWPYISLRLYINKTGNLQILNQKTCYFSDHLFAWGKKLIKPSGDDFILRDKKGRVYEGTVLEHLLLELLTAFFNVGRHNILRLENADWNDGLDMAAQNGESTAFSFMYAHHLEDICRFLRLLEKETPHVCLLKEIAPLLNSMIRPAEYGDWKKKQAVLRGFFRLSENISGEKVNIKTGLLIKDLEHKSKSLKSWLNKREWLKEGFFNGYYDNSSRRVEGKINGRARMMLASSVFSILSGAADKEKIKQIYRSVKLFLYDKETGGFRLNTDFARAQPDLGRAFGFSYGDKENGGFFNHMSVMLAHALYSRGFIKEGYEAFSSVYNMACSKKSLIYPMIPEYFNKEGRGLYHYLTGSASWYIYTLFQEILGVRFSLGNLIIQPKLMAEQFSKKPISVSFSFCGKQIELTYIKDTTLKKGPLLLQRAALQNKYIPAKDGAFCLLKNNLKKQAWAKNLKITAYLK